MFYDITGILKMRSTFGIPTYIWKLCYRNKILFVFKNESLNSKIRLNNPDTPNNPWTPDLTNPNISDFWNPDMPTTKSNM